MRIYSVIVCYNPDISNLIQICQKLIKNHSAVIMVDNTEESYISRYIDFPNCTLISLWENTGIAHAQNIGIKYAIDGGADVIVFLDQDSEIKIDFLPSLLAPLRLGVPKIVAPVFFDNTKGFEFPSYRLNKYGLPVKVYKGDKCIPYDVDIITSSGTATTAVTFEIAGLMDEDLFIDYVDTEWSLRCRRKKIPIQVVPTAVMRHSVGDTSINLGFMRIFVHSPARSYYRIRNSFVLFRKVSVPFSLACKEIIVAIISYIILIIFVKNRILYVQNYLLAILHGIRGIVGKKPT